MTPDKGSLSRSHGAQAEESEKLVAVDGKRSHAPRFRSFEVPVEMTSRSDLAKKLKTGSAVECDLSAARET